MVIYERGLISLVFDLEACTMIDVKTRDETQASIMMVVERIVNISSVKMSKLQSM